MELGYCEYHSAIKHLHVKTEWCVNWRVDDTYHTSKGTDIDSKNKTDWFDVLTQTTWLIALGLLPLWIILADNCKYPNG